MHTPVLLQEVLRIVQLHQGEFVIDATLGGGGYATELRNVIGKTGTFLGIDWDKQVIEKMKAKLAETKNTYLVNENFANICSTLEKMKLCSADVIVADLGFSSMQLEESGRGFSFQKNEPLLMTYSDIETPVRDILKTISEKELALIIQKFSQEKFAQKIAHAIKTNKTLIQTSNELAEIIKGAVPKNYENGRIHPATRTFQALRIYTNHELENLETFLKQLPFVLKLTGRVAIVSFHSEEDRLIKQYFNKYAKEKTFELLTKKPIEAQFEEIKNNPRSRSAKLRAAKRI